MKFAPTLYATLLGSIAVMTSPSENEVLSNLRHSRLNERLKTLVSHSSKDTTPDVTYNENWAGPVLTGAGYRTVIGTIRVPSVKLPPGANSNVLHAVSAWVGIDGEYACPNAIVQVGIDMYLNHSVPAYWAWFGWFPNRSTYLADFPIHPGDSITMNLTATSLRSAIFSITNHRTGQRDSVTLADQAPMVCGFSAEWIVEDFWASDGVPLVDFGNITFTEAKFATDTGITGGVKGAVVEGVKEEADGDVVIECEKVGGEAVTCSYKGSKNP